MSFESPQSFESQKSNESPRSREKRLRIEKQSEAGRTLTRLVATLFPDVIQREANIDTFVLEDSPEPDGGDGYPQMTEEEREIFNASASRLFKGLEKVGLGLAVTDHTFAYTYDPEAKRAYLNTLANPWEYFPNGEVQTVIDLKKLTRLVNAIKNEEEKGEALEILAELTRQIQHEETDAPERYLESLDEPNSETLSKLVETLDSIPEALIVELEGITTEEEAKKHEGREYLRLVMRPALGVAWKEIHEGSKLETDHDKEKYPEFWEVYARIARVRNAIGAIRHGRVEHDRE